MSVLLGHKPWVDAWHLAIDSMHAVSQQLAIDYTLTHVVVYINTPTYILIWTLAKTSSTDLLLMFSGRLGTIDTCWVMSSLYLVCCIFGNEIESS